MVFRSEPQVSQQNYQFSSSHLAQHLLRLCFIDLYNIPYLKRYSTNRMFYTFYWHFFGVFLSFIFAVFTVEASEQQATINEIKVHLPSEQHRVMSEGAKAEDISPIQRESTVLQELVLGVEDSPPYVISAQNSGLEVDIIRAALRAVGYKLRIEYMTTGRGVRLLLNKRVDIVTPIYHADSERFYLAAPHVFYRPSLFSLAPNELSIRSIDDIARGSVAAYKGVLSGFGAKFQHIARQCPLFVELGDPRRIVDMLYLKRVDIAILDLHAFQYFLHASGLDASKLNIHDLIEPVPVSAAFHDNLLKRKYEKGVRIILRNGEYERIAARYLDSRSASNLIQQLEKQLTSL